MPMIPTQKINFYRDDMRFNIDNILYQRSIDPIKENDLVFDTYDGSYGYCDMIKEDRIAIKYDNVAEIAIPIERCFKLIPSLETNSKN